MSQRSSSEAAALDICSVSWFFYSPVPPFSIEMMVALEAFDRVCSQMDSCDTNDRRLDRTRSGGPGRPSSEGAGSGVSQAQLSV